MNPFSIDAKRDVNAVIDKEIRLIAFTKPLGLFRQNKELPACKVLFSELNRSRSTFQCALKHPDEISPSGLVAVGNEVKIEVGRSQWQNRVSNLRCHPAG